MPTTGTKRVLWWRIACALAATACACGDACVNAQEAAQADPVMGEQDFKPLAAYENYMGYLNNLVPLLGVLLLFFVYFGMGDPEKSIKGPKVRVSHILVQEEADADVLLKQLKSAKKKTHMFADLALKKSSCPSKNKGGHMGVFGKGQMMPEFEKIAFVQPVGSVHKIKTKFGWHVMLITERDDTMSAKMKKH